MLEVKTNKEILKIKSRLFYGLSGKQFFLLLCGFFCGVIVFMVFHAHIIIRLLIMNLIIGGFVFSGTYTMNGLSPIKLLKEMACTMKMRLTPLLITNERRNKDA